MRYFVRSDFRHSLPSGGVEGIQKAAGGFQRGRYTVDIHGMTPAGKPQLLDKERKAGGMVWVLMGENHSSQLRKRNTEKQQTLHHVAADINHVDIVIVFKRKHGDGPVRITEGGPRA